jgi:membrane-associated phospholipid phosphatase
VTPHPIRRVVTIAGPLIAVWVGLVALLIVCGEGVKHSAAIGTFDQRITTFVVDHRTPALNHLMTAVTWVGSWIADLCVAVIVAAFAVRRRLPPVALAAVLAAWLGELAAVTLAKTVVERERPPKDLWLVVAHGWSFPSGHAANAVVVFSVSAGIACMYVRRRNARVLTWAGAVLAVALVGFSRIELGVHWTTDVIASAVWTTCWLLILAKVGSFKFATPDGRGRRPNICDVPDDQRKA